MKLGLQSQSADANRRLASPHAEALNPARSGPPQALGLGRGSVGRGGAGQSGAPLPGCPSEAGTVCGWVLCTAWYKQQERAGSQKENSYLQREFMTSL